MLFCAGRGGVETRFYDVGGGTFPIPLPIFGIVHNVLANTIEAIFVADDVFVIITLPYRITCGVLMGIDASCRKCFECPNNFR